MNKNDLVTIGITTFNSDLGYLSKSIESAINQTYLNIEIIVSDDGSSNIDEIEDLIYKFADSRIVFIKNKKNEGVSNSLNHIIAKANGNYFCWCPDDDFMDRNKIEEQVMSLKNKPNFISLTDHIQIIDYYKIQRKFSHKYYLKFLDVYLYSIIFDRINGGALMIPTKILKNLKFDKNLKHVQDYDMWHKILNKYKCVYLNKALFYSRQHSKQSSEISNLESKNEISKFYLNFFEQNLFQLLYIYGKKIYFLIYTSFIFREFKDVHKFLNNQSTINKYYKNLFNVNFLFYFNLNLFKILGNSLKITKNLKNYFFYKFLYNK